MKIGPTIPTAALAFDPGGRLLAVGGYQEVLIWDLTSGRLQKRTGSGQLGYVVHAVAFNAVAFNPNGRLLAVADGTRSSSGAVKVFDIDTGQPVLVFEEPKDVGEDAGKSAKEKKQAADLALGA